MISTLQQHSAWPRRYFFGLECLVVALSLLISFSGWRGGDFPGLWPSWTLVALLVILFVLSLAFIRHRTALAISGLLVVAVSVAAGFLFPMII